MIRQGRGFKKVKMIGCFKMLSGQGQDYQHQRRVRWDIPVLFVELLRV